VDKMTGRVALVELKKFKAIEAEYRADKEEWYRNGDGRSPKWYQGPDDDRPYNYGGKGYSYPYCIHGSSNWTDYDNICGGCEESLSVYQRAIWSAQEKVDEYRKRVDWVVSAPDSLDWDVKRDLIDWACKPVR
jgi:hypothetical protein